MKWERDVVSMVDSPEGDVQGAAESGSGPGTQCDHGQRHQAAARAGVHLHGPCDRRAQHAVPSLCFPKHELRRVDEAEQEGVMTTCGPKE